jgi:hypothetical protein
MNYSRKLCRQTNNLHFLFKKHCRHEHVNVVKRNEPICIVIISLGNWDKWSWRLENFRDSAPLNKMWSLCRDLALIFISNQYALRCTHGQYTQQEYRSHPNRSIPGFSTLIVLFYLNCCITFYTYLYAIVSKIFRQEIKRMILKCFTRTRHEQAHAVSGLTGHVGWKSRFEGLENV